MWLNLGQSRADSPGNPMRSRNYTKEIGIETGERRVPAAATAAVVALVIVAAWLFARQVNSVKHTAAEPVHAPVKVSSR